MTLICQGFEYRSEQYRLMTMFTRVYARERIHRYCRVKLPAFFRFQTFVVLEEERAIVRVHKFLRLLT